MARFDGVHAFGYNSARSEAIWIKIETLWVWLIATGPGKGHIAINCRITFNHLSTAAMHLISNYCHHLLSLNAQIDSRTDSQVLRVEYCIVFIEHNTAI